MNDSSQLVQIAKGIRGLTIAVWVLVLINLLQTSAWFVPLVAPRFVAETALSMPKDTFESWDGLSLEEKIKRSNVVVIIEHRADGGKLRAIVKEVRKLKPDAVFQYQVGEEYGPLTITPKADTSYGDGAVVLLSGSPAKMHESYSVYGGSISGLDEMPVSKFLELVDKTR